MPASAASAPLFAPATISGTLPAPSLDRSSYHHHSVDKGIGTKEFEGWIGDCLIAYCCGPCNMCQLYRAMPKEGWDWLPNFPPKEVMVEPCKLCLE